MSNKTALIAMAISLAYPAASAMAEGPMSIEQSGNNNSTSIEQILAVNASAATTQRDVSNGVISILQGNNSAASTNSNATINQINSSNVLSVTQQTGDMNSAKIDQSNVAGSTVVNGNFTTFSENRTGYNYYYWYGYGYYSRTSSGVDGPYIQGSSTHSSFANVMQNGVSNNASIMQSNSSNITALISQSGDNNLASTSQNNISGSVTNSVRHTGSNGYSYWTGGSYYYNWYNYYYGYEYVSRINNSYAFNQTSNPAATSIMQSGYNNNGMIHQNSGSNVSAHIDQAGTANFANIEQMNVLGSVQGNANDLTTSSSMTSSSAAVGQSGTNNIGHIYQSNGVNVVASLIQSGTGNTGTITQNSGNQLFGAIAQSGDSNNAVLTQSFGNNSATASQNGSFNEANIIQFGTGNQASITQIGMSNAASIAQYGANNTASINQNGGNLHATILQSGNQNVISITQR